MSQSPPNYMEGVPVKISEKYKPPPIITLPHSILQRNKTNDESNWSQLQYDFNLERSVLSKIEQWKKVREVEKENLRQRLRRHERERAREIEENQKQLLTAVSYPSAEELSSDEEATYSPPVAAAGSQDCIQGEPAIKAAASVAQFSPSQQRFDTILMPTVVPETCNKSKMNSAKSNNFSKINYSDFENDTSSPFDNVELKTINDLDILAQVLNITQIHSKDAAPDERIENTEQNSNKGSEEPTEELCINGNPIVQPANPYPTTFLESTNKLPYQDQVVSPGFSSAGRAVGDELPYYNNLPGNQLYNGYAGGNYALNLEANHSSLENYHRTLLNQINYGNHSVLDVHSSYSDSAIVSSARSKSKSVPDILKELNDEITDSEMRRSQCIEETLERDKVRNRENHIKPISRAEQEIPQSFVKLSPSLQGLVKNISLMGFPLERVSRIAEKLGNDDKKIFEHLIPLSELLDLGFDESKISEALLRFDNNKDKALDFLIS